jgi:hypothetical protein
LPQSVPELHNGDIVLFHRLTLRQSIRAEGWLWGILGWLGQFVIMLCQRELCPSATGHQDGFHHYVHVGIVTHSILPYEGWQLIEWTWPNGCVISHAVKRLSEYGGAVHVAPLNDRYAQKINGIAEWVRKHSHMGYRWGGLPFAVFQDWMGWKNPNAMFCSEAIMHIFLDFGMAPPFLPVNRSGRLVQGEIKPQAFSPCEIARLPQLDRDAFYVWR